MKSAFLKKLAQWRRQLTAELENQHPHLEPQQLHEAVQRMLDRLLFLRICQARQVISDRFLPNLSQQDHLGERLWQLGTDLDGDLDTDLDGDHLGVRLCRWSSPAVSDWDAEGRFNPGVSDESLRTVIRGMLALENPVAIELLGQLYEQFLRQSQATTRKANGIYYTPSPIVEYMVRHTLCSQLQGRTVKTMQHLPLRVLDPACGAGSFLLRAYQELLNWYRNQYQANLAQWGHWLYRPAAGAWRLTLAAKQQILLRHLYGVDLDPQAVKIAQRSLLLLLLEGLVEQPTHLKKTAIDPTGLAGNLRWGNALMGSDCLLRSNACFDWEVAFPEIMQTGGFDVVIGNPPWVFTRDAQFDDRLKQYYQKKYLAPLRSDGILSKDVREPDNPNCNAIEWGIQSRLNQAGKEEQAPTERYGDKTKQAGKVNLFILFLLQFIHLTHPQGVLGILIPNTILRTTVYDGVRKYLLEQCNIQQIVDLDNDTFPGITAGLVILILGKNPADSRVHFYQGMATSTPAILNKTAFLKNTSHVFSVLVSPAESCLFSKMEGLSIPLAHLARSLMEGIVCRRDQVNSTPLNSQYQKLLEGKDIQRYHLIFRQNYVWFDRQQLHRPRPDYLWSAPEKIILRRIGGSQFPLIAVLDTDNYYTFASTNNLLLKTDCFYNIRYILALLNSKLLNHYYVKKFTNRSRLTVNIAKTFVQQLPIKTIQFDQKSDRVKHDQLVELAENLQLLHPQLMQAKTREQGRSIQTQINILDQQIDQIVYELYQLTDQEIAALTFS